MRLAKLTVAGFKSFADKTEIRFDEPIVGIVGPNGCGKSNVVDAIKWVLGDQSPKSLRGGAMMDVIFNGSAKRRPSGMASVTLTFDNPITGENNQRPLPLDVDQVAITRELYRDGTSAYRINNQRARLRDVRETFMDTGIGTDAYSIIEQGKVARMLEANGSERRQIFEEAAGVARFKARKKEALRKLDRAEQNLALVRTRLEDTQRRLRSVKMQAARARSYREHACRLRELQLTHGLAEYHTLSKELTELNELLEQAEADRAVAARKLAEHEHAQEDAEQDRAAVAEKLKQFERARHEQQSAKDQAQQQQAFAKRTLEETAKQTERDTQRLGELSQQAERLMAEQSAAAEEIASLEGQRADEQERLQTAQNEHRAAQKELHQQRASLEDEKNGLVDLMRRAADLKNQVRSLQSFAESLQANRSKIESRSGDIAQQLKELLTSRDASRDALREAESLIQAEQGKLDERRTLAGKFGDQIKSLTDRLSSQREKRATLDSRRQVLREMEENLEGIGDAVKAVLARAAADGKEGAANPFSAVRGMLAELIDADVADATLVEAALGEHQQALVVDRLAELCDTRADELRGSLSGRVMFLALDQPPLPDVSLRTFDGTALRVVADCVRYPDWLGPIVWRLLGRTVVVEDLDRAMLLRAGLPDGFRFVTRAGEVLDEQGRVVAGPLGTSAGAGVI
ncbi:MAG: AAA family ATPase, partial [Planctomycetota bacterium]